MGYSRFFFSALFFHNFSRHSNWGVRLANLRDVFGSSSGDPIIRTTSGLLFFSVIIFGSKLCSIFSPFFCTFLGPILKLIFHYFFVKSLKKNTKKNENFCDHHMKMKQLFNKLQQYWKYMKYKKVLSF